MIGGEKWWVQHSRTASINSLKHLYLAFYDKSDESDYRVLNARMSFFQRKRQILTTRKKKVFMHLFLEKKKKTNTDRHNWTEAGKSSVAKNEFLKRRGKTNFRWERMDENNFNDAKLNV